MEIENIEVWGFTPAVRGMRNPHESWGKGDSEEDSIGPSDLDLARRLVHAGAEHRKFLRQIIIWMDLTLPLYIWTELDTYKIGTVRNSCSTIHSLGKREIIRDDFERGQVLDETLTALNALADLERTPDAIRRMKALLPAGYLQRATYMLNYEVALNIYSQRRNHTLPEWAVICNVIKSLPHIA